MEFWEVVQLIVGSVIIIIAAYYTTYFIASRKGKTMTGREIRVHERFSLAKDKMICVVEIRGKAYLVVITNGGATLLDTFDAEEFAEQKEQPSPYGASSGLIQRGLMAGFNALRKGTSSKQSTAKKSGSDRADFASSMKRAGADEIINVYGNDEKDSDLNVAAEEDGIDEMYRRLQNRRAHGTLFPDSEEKEDRNHE